MKRKGIFWLWFGAVFVGALALLFAPLFSFGQDIAGVSGVSGDVKTEEGLAELLHAMFFQVLNRPASLLVIIALSIISMMAEIVEWCPSNPVKVIMPFCIIGGMAIYWMFSSTSGVDRQYPYPHAVLAVNGLVCGLVAFIAHIMLVKFVKARLAKDETKTK